MATAFWLLVFWLQGISLEPLIPGLVRFGFVSAAMIFAWWAFVHYLWRAWPVRILLRLKLPDLHGRWVGTYISSYDRKDRSMALEIRQTMLNLQCISYAKDVRAESFTARLLSDPDGGTFSFAYIYHGEHMQHTAIPGDEHQGAALLVLEPSSPKRLSGSYFNDRKPEQRRGHVELIYESRKLKGAL